MRGLWLGLAGISFVLAIATAVIAAAVGYTAGEVIYIIVFIVPGSISLYMGLRPRTRPCPRCGRRVKRDELDCPSCAFDFRSVG